MSYSICNQIITFKYLENSQIKEKEVEIILPDRSELCNEEGFMLVFELNKLAEKKAKAEAKRTLEVGKLYAPQQEMLQPLLNKIDNQAKIEEEARQKGQDTNILWSNFYLNLSIKEKELLNCREMVDSEYPDQDYYLDIYKVLVKKVYQPNYEPNFNWFNPSIKFENFVESYLIEYKKYQNVFLVTGPEVKEKQNQKTTGIGEPNKMIKAKKQLVVS